MSESRITAEQRRLIVAQAKGCCEYCYSQIKFATQSFSVEHILPRSKGGTTTPENLALSCQGCNNHKFTKTGGVDLVTGEATQLFHPRQQSWLDHLTWNEDYSLIIGLTPIGRVTVSALRLNRPGLINLRRVLFLLGEHPPAN